MATLSSHGACTTVGKGGVGESGPYEQIIHTVGGTLEKNIVLRCTASSLCANTAAVALIAVNGTVVASGQLPGPGSSIQSNANPGDHVVAIVHSVPLFNNIMCVRLGELEVALDECDLVREDPSGTGCTVLGNVCAETRNWYAWNNKMPPKPDDFHVVGDVDVPNPGVDVELMQRVPQGINPAILLLDLVLIQRPGIWPQLVTTRQVSYSRILLNSDYTEADVFMATKLIAKIPVETVQ